MTNETMTWNGWLHEVLSTAKVSVDELEPFRDKVLRWFQAGEPVWMAADTLRMAVKERKNQIRIEEQANKDMPKNLLKHAIIGGLTK